MNKKLIRCRHSGIDYIDRSWGVFSGCLNIQKGICPINACWARGLAMHYTALYPDGFNPHFYPEALDSPKYVQRPSIISVGWTGDVIGYGFPYRKLIFSTIEACPWHTFLFLTKNYDELLDWTTFPDNCGVGITTCNRDMLLNGCRRLQDVRAGFKFISFEPLLEETYCLISTLALAGIDWIIIGAQTRPEVLPKIEWVTELINIADRLGIAVFLKDNLAPLLEQSGRTDLFSRRELPAAAIKNMPVEARMTHFSLGGRGPAGKCPLKLTGAKLAWAGG